MVDHDGLIPYLALLGAVALSTWIVGKFAGPEADAPQKFRAWGAAVLVLLVTVFLLRGSLVSLRDQQEPSAATLSAGFQESVTARPGKLPWQPWSPTTLEQARQTGRPVFVDFTAAWCLICKANEAAALDVPETIALFEQHGIIALKADWTRRPREMTEAIESYGRAGVPIYVFYPRPGAEAVLLPETLTPDVVRRTIESALGAR